MLCLVMPDSLWLCRLQPARLLCPWGILKAQILEWLPCSQPEALSNPGMKSRSLAFQKDSLPSEPTGKPKNTGVAYPFSRETAWPRNQTRVSCITGVFFTSWANRKDILRGQKKMVFEQFTEDVNRDQHGFTKNQIKLLKFLICLFICFLVPLFSPFFFSFLPSYIVLLLLHLFFFNISLLLLWKNKNNAFDIPFPKFRH